MATAPATPANMTLDRSDGSATLDLYRAALGPVRTDYYLKAFTRFDAAGKTSPSWNWMAALLTVNWLLFRRLWIQLLAYVGAMAAALLLLFGIGRLLFQLGEAAQWGLLGLVLLLAVGVPGAFGNAWLYAACNKAMEAALATSTQVEEACALLATRAANRKHMAGLVAGNLAAAGLLATLVLMWPNSSALPLKTSKMEGAREAAPITLQSGLATQSVAAAKEPSSAPLVALAAPAPTRSSQGLVQAAPEAAAVPASEPAAAATPAAATSPTATATATPASGKYLINVGLFANPNNAHNAYAKLREAGLPASSQAVKSAQGVRTRVRAGPFASEAEANSAVEKIHALRLEAALLKP